MFLYDIAKSFDFNVQHGPFFTGNVPPRNIPATSHWKKVFDYNVMSCLGISACPLTANAKGIQLASLLGYDIITCKTMRRTLVAPHPWPHVTPIANRCINDLNEPMYAQSLLSSNDAISYANSMGNPSFDVHENIEAIKKGRTFLQEGQILIGSIYATGDTESEIINDFVYLSDYLKEAGVHAIEANLSCPNLQGEPLYKDASFVYKLGNAIVSRIAPIPFIIKVSLFQDDALMKAVLIATAQSGIRGIAGINSIAMQVVDENNNPYFGVQRRMAGVSGDVIRPYAITFIQNARNIIDREKLDLTLLGGGGIIRASQIDKYFTVGAHAAMMATGALVNPYLASEYHKKKDVCVEY
jgi:dihydroorotate dehydrogenase